MSEGTLPRPKDLVGLWQPTVSKTVHAIGCAYYLGSGTVMTTSCGSREHAVIDPKPLTEVPDDAHLCSRCLRSEISRGRA